MICNSRQQLTFDFKIHIITFYIFVNFFVLSRGKIMFSIMLLIILCFMLFKYYGVKLITYSLVLFLNDNEFAYLQE